MMRSKSYCRCLCVPVYSGNKAEQAIDDDLHCVEVLLTIPKESFFFTSVSSSNSSRKDILHLTSLHSESYDETDGTYPSRVCIMLWMNQSYREKYEVLRDITECFLGWFCRNFGNANLVHREVFRCVLPLDQRGWKEKEEYYFIGDWRQLLLCL